jgi:hypothetical protein
MLFALVEAEDGRFVDALDAFARITTGSLSPASYSSSLCVTIVCELIGWTKKADH